MKLSSRILVVDDEPRGVELVARSLRPLGEVETTTSGEAAWELVRSTGFDLVVSDQRMPGWSGVELLARVADRDDHTGRILLTGYSDLSATIEAINRARVHAYLGKPCPPDRLRLTAKTVLERVRLARENERLLGALHQKNEKLEEALVSVRELTQRVIESERLSAIAGMIAQIVHDFRGPLSVVSATGRQLRMEDRLPEGEVRELAEQIVEESERMTRMCSELLDVTRASAGPPRRVEEDLDEVVESALAALLHDASLRGIRIDTQLRSRVQLPLDEDRFRRVILNLGYNALDAMEDGGVLRVTTERSERHATVSVWDTGRGIPEHLREKIFDPFVTAGKVRGSGLGLAIVKKVVEEHDGRVELGKPEGAGTVFHLHLPLPEGP